MTTLERGLRVAVALLLTAAVVRPVAHAQDNLRDAAPFNGYTGVKFDTTAYKYDYLVDSSLSQDDPAGRKFKTLQAAYAAAPAGTPEKPTVIGIKPDVYLMHVDESAPYSLQVTKNYITILGLTDDRRKVVLADNRGNKEGATNNGFIFDINATGFTMMNLTVVNYANLDYEYPGDPSKNLKKRSDVITQAVAIQMQGDKHVYSHVAFLSRLDTTFIRTTRSYFTNVFIEGTDDFLGGGTVGVFKDSEIYFPTGNGVMSASGLTFINTVFKASRGLEFYKGFGSPDTLIDCTMPVDTPSSPVTWMAWDVLPVHQNLYSLTYHVKDASGKPMRIKDKIKGAPTYTLSRELSDQEVKAFNPWNLLRAALPNGPVDDWDPANVRAQYESNSSDVFRMSISGPPPAGDVPGGGPFVSRAVSPTVRTGGATATVTANILPARAKDTPITWSTTSDMATLSSTTGNKVTISGNNKTGRAEYVAINAKAANGFYVTVHAYVEPAFVDPPKFTSQPAIATPADGKAAVHYALALGGHEDQSLITWSECDDAACANPRKVAVSRGNQPLRSYTLTAGDIGKYLHVSIRPKHNISDPGPDVTATAAKPITAAEVKLAVVDPNFRNFVETESPAFVNGEWTLVGTWTSVTGDSLVNGYGLRVSGLMGAAPNRGFGGGAAPPPPDPNAPRVPNPYAALIYNHDEPTADMQMKVVMSPEKTAGQGFGIAGSPDDIPRVERSDIFIKYDPRTKNGYSLRFWRTIQAADKCMFQLYKIENGVGHPVNSQQQLTGVFKPNTTILLSIVGSKFTVKGSNTTDGETLSLEGTVAPNPYGSAGVYWSGSVPVGNSNVYSEMQISYPGKSTH
ncbi:MAG TPA: pectinesterase family protein [Acidobacteriaceae bacterium]